MVSAEAPSIASNGGDILITVWSENGAFAAGAGLDTDLYFAVSMDAGGSWSDPALLNSNATTDGSGSDNAPIIAYGGGTWVVAWNANRALGLDQDLLYVVSSNNGASWSDPLPLNSYADSDIGSDHIGAIAFDGSTWMINWASRSDESGAGTDFDIFFTVSTIGPSPVIVG